MPIIPTFAIVPVLIAAFVILACDIYILNPSNYVLNIRFILMFSAVAMMFLQILLSNLLPWLSFPLFLLGLVWLAAAIVLMRRRLAGLA